MPRGSPIGRQSIDLKEVIDADDGGDGGDDIVDDGDDHEDDFL